MSEAFGPDFVSVTDDEGNEFELEHLGTLEHEGITYMAFLPADMDEEDPDYGMILLKVIQDNGEDLLADIDNQQELDQIYDLFLEQLFQEEEDEEE